MDYEKILEGAPYHEAGHAVAAHHHGFEVRNVIASPEQDITNIRSRRPTTWTDFWRQACVTMAGQLADQRFCWGVIRPEPWEEFRTIAEEGLEQAKYGEEGALDDHTEILEYLELMAAHPDGDDPEESYRTVVEDTRALVTEHWNEIEAVARALVAAPHGALDGPEVTLLIAEADEREPRYETPDGYFNFPEGRGQVVFLDDDGRPMSREEWLAYLEEKRKDHRVIGSGTKEDPYRAPGTAP